MAVAVMQKAVDLQAQQQRDLAVRIANAQGGGKTVDGRAGGVSTR